MQSSVHSEHKIGEKVTVDDVDDDVKVKKRGRPHKEKDVMPDSGLLVDSKTRSSAFPVTSAIPPVTPPPPKPPGPSRPAAGSSTRPRLYLLESVGGDSLPSSKLPKTKHVLRRLLELYGEKIKYIKKSNELKVAAGEASKQVAVELRDVWGLHFGVSVVFGKDNLGEVKEDESKKIIIRREHIEEKILKVYKEYKKLESESKRPARCESESFKKNESLFKEVLDTPFNISKKDAERRLKDSHILDWREDWQHLQNQMKKNQEGTLGAKDTRQHKRDVRVQQAKKSAAVAADRSASEVEKMFEKEKSADSATFEDNNENDADYNGNERKNTTKKIDVMGPVSNTGDRLGLSVRDKAMFAAAVVKSVGVDLNDTNISFSTAAKKARKRRFETEKDVIQSFVPPDNVVLHWDGKVLKLEAGKKADFICVYISGADPAQVTKLLGVPEVDSGSGVQQKQAVVQMLTKWGISEQIIGLVFDTTSSNTGGEIGACKLLEDHLDKPILWLACRHHIYELHIKHVVEAVTGVTKDPGVKLFRRLKSEWNNLVIDDSKLVKFDHKQSNSWLCYQARTVLAWAEDHYLVGTWPRCDYKELLELVIIWLGGELKSFSFKFPGADHHARWLSKGIYYMKLALLSEQFEMDQKEKE